MNGMRRPAALAIAAACLLAAPARAQAPEPQGPASQSPALQSPAPQSPTVTPQDGHEHPAPAEQKQQAKRTPAPADAYVYIGWPNDGEVIHSNRFKVWFGTRNFGVAPAGTSKPNTGHHHLLIDVPLPPMDEAIPNDKHHLHFGLGQTETVLELPPGTHTLQLLMGDADHVPHDPPVMSRRITIHVRGGAGSVAAAR